MAIAPNNPEIERFHTSEDLHYALVKLEEFALFLKTEEKRLIEKEAALYVVRAVLNDDNLEILYEESGKPYLKNGMHISISHSDAYLAVLFSKTSAVGIDIEKVRDKIILIRRKFLSAEELQRVQNASLEEHTVYWCAKEALYKASGISGLIFAEQLHIEPFTYSGEGGKINALLTHPDSKKKYTLRYKVSGDTILVYTDTALA